MKKILIGAIPLMLISCSTPYTLSYLDHNEIHKQHWMEALSVFESDSVEIYIPDFIKPTSVISENKNLVLKQK